MIAIVIGDFDNPKWKLPDDVKAAILESQANGRNTVTAVFDALGRRHEAADRKRSQN